jgi:23S rRNA (adenine2503-C2)-methyltransferase
MYVHGARDFSTMTTIAKDLREALGKEFSLQRPEVVSEQVSRDGTRKWLLRMGDTEIETVYIPEEDRGTLCISSQVGCTLNCTFCNTGTQKWVRNLTAGEIISQVMLARDAVGEWPGCEPDHPYALPKSERKITNVVLMGMGEPLYNFDNVRQAIDIIADGEGLSVSRRRITLSTAGVVPMIEPCGSEMGVMLAISLHATSDDVRNKLVPLNRKYPIKQLLDACRKYPGLSNARRITFEYVMLKGINDSPDDARRLVRLLAGIPAKVNLLPFNPWPGSPYVCSDPATIDTFARFINNAGYASPVRTPRGVDIMAACGQLKSESARKKRTRTPIASTAVTQSHGPG